MLSLFKSSKFLSLYFKAWKYICYLWTIELQSSFLLNSHDNLLGNIGLILRYFDSLSASKWKDHLMLSEQFQNAIELLEFVTKNSLRFFNIVMKWSWYQKYSMKYIYSTSQILKLSLILCTFSITSSVASLFLT